MVVGKPERRCQMATWIGIHKSCTSGGAPRAALPDDLRGSHRMLPMRCRDPGAGCARPARHSNSGATPGWGATSEAHYLQRQTSGPHVRDTQIETPPGKVATESMRKVSTDGRVANGPEPILKSAPEGIRTPNLLIRSQMLYPLSYGRKRSMFSCVADAVSRGGGERI